MHAVRAMATVMLATFLALLIGAALGLLGGGGGILAVPVLVYVVGLDAKAAIASSLLIVGVTSAVGVALAAREGRVRWTIGALFGGGSMAGAFFGGKLAIFVPDRWLLVGLAIVMLLTALAMLRAPRAQALAAPRPAIGRSLAVGAGVGLLSGMVGAGGGFLLVPALTIFGGLVLPEAIGTSLLIITLQSFAGFAGHVDAVQISLPIVGAMIAAALVGLALGRALGGRLAPHTLKASFAALVATTGLFLLTRHVSPLVAAVVAALTLLAAVSLAHQRRTSPHPPTKEPPCTTSRPSLPSPAEPSSGSPQPSTSSPTDASAASAASWAGSSNESRSS